MKLGRRRGNDFCMPDQYGFLISWRRCQIVAMFFSIFHMFVFSDIQGSYLRYWDCGDFFWNKKETFDKHCSSLSLLEECDHGSRSKSIFVDATWSYIASESPQGSLNGGSPALQSELPAPLPALLPALMHSKWDQLLVGRWWQADMTALGRRHDNIGLSCC